MVGKGGSFGSIRERWWAANAYMRRLAVVQRGRRGEGREARVCFLMVMGFAMSRHRLDVGAWAGIGDAPEVGLFVVLYGKSGLRICSVYRGIDKSVASHRGSKTIVLPSRPMFRFVSLSRLGCVHPGD